MQASPEFLCTLTCTGGVEDSQDDGEGSGPLHCKHWVIRHTFDNLAYFNHDTEPSRSDPPRRVLDWLEVSKQVGGRVPWDRVVGVKWSKLCSSAVPRFIAGIAVLPQLF